MGSGQSALDDQTYSELHHEHVVRLQKIGVGEIANIIDDVDDLLRRFETDISLPKHRWQQLDRIKELIKFLK